MYDLTAIGKILTQKRKNLVVETQNKLFICPYFREEVGGQEGYQNVLIFYVLTRGRREWVNINMENV